MSYLFNQKKERFCQAYVDALHDGPVEAIVSKSRSRSFERECRLKAYEIAGYFPGSSMESNARRLANSAEVKDRIAELFRDACQYRGITAIKVANRVDNVGAVNIADFYEEDGKTLRNIKTLPREMTDAIESIEWIEDGVDAGGDPKYRAKLKLFDKNAANFTLLKHFNGLPDLTPQAPSTTNNILNILSLDDQRVLLDFIQAAERGPGVSGGDDRGQSDEGPTAP
jgi:Terminase small subunit